MALWSHVQDNRWTQVSFAKKEIAADVYLCCPGPSLRHVQDAALHKPGILVFAINTAFPHIRPDVWVGMDTPACYHPSLWWQPFIKIARRAHAGQTCGGDYIYRCPMTYFADLVTTSPLDMFSRRNHDTAFVWQGNTFFVALHIAVWMGAQRIFLLGNDLGRKDDRDYYDDRQLRPEQRDRNARLYRWTRRMLPRVARVGKEYGITITSCTPDSPVNDEIGYIPLDEALEQSQRRVPARLVRSPLYCVDASLTAWNKNPAIAPEGVVVGVAPSQAWMLPWWWHNYRAHNHHPVAFADFGLGPDQQAWCRERGILIEVADIPANGWFRKPFAILRAPFQKILWLDLDTEVKAPIAPLFRYAENPVAIAARPASLDGTCAHEHPYGWFTMLPPQAKAFCTGVVVTARGNPLVCEWAQMCLADQQRYRGDNEPLAVLEHCRPGSVVEIAPELACSTFRDGTDAAIVHWRGPVGKQKIRQLLAGASTQ